MGMNSHDPPSTVSETNEDLVVQLAVTVLAGKGWIEEPDDALLATLRRVYNANPICQQEVKFTGELLHDMLAARPGEYLATAWEKEQQDHWERHHAERWSCPCGEPFGLYPLGGTRAAYYTLADDGLFLEQATHCPHCGRDLAATRKDLPAGQLGFAL